MRSPNTRWDEKEPRLLDDDEKFYYKQAQECIDKAQTPSIGVVAMLLNIIDRLLKQK